MGCKSQPLAALLTKLTSARVSSAVSGSDAEPGIVAILEHNDNACILAPIIENKSSVDIDIIDDTWLWCTVYTCDSVHTVYS